MSDPFALRMPPDIRSVRIGGHHAVFVDNFLEDPTAVLEAAYASRFEPYPKAADGKGYPGIRAEAPSAYTESLMELIEPLIKINFGVPEELPLRKSICAYSLIDTPPEQAGIVQRVPHIDASTPYYMSCVLYLCDEHHGGTGFYRHKATGIQQVLPENKERYLDAYHQENLLHPPPLRYFDASNEHYEFLGMLPAKFNRLALFPGSLIHTACLNPALSISADPRKGRLTLNSFFDFGEVSAESAPS